MKKHTPFMVAFLLWAVLVLSVLAGDGEDVFVHLPYIAKSGDTPTPTMIYTPTVTNTPIFTNTPSPTSTPSPTATADPQPSGIVTITEIFFDGAEPNHEGDEYVEIRNDDSVSIQLEIWTLSDEGDIHVFIFPNYLMLPGEVCRIYTDEDHSEWCGFNYMNGHAIWNNDKEGDTATLRDGDGTVIDTCTYIGIGTTAVCD